MLFDLPPHHILYQALLERSQSYDGRAFVCVASTGIFCRLTCPARKPKPENCTFYASVGECMAAGFRACKRCYPLSLAAEADPEMARLLAALDKAPERRWSEQDLSAMGYDLSTVRRSFKRQFGMTFLELARQRRLRGGFETLASGGRVIEAQIDAGFSSPSAFRAAFARLIGKPPGALARSGLLLADWIETPLGSMIAVASSSHLHLLEFLDRPALKTELARLIIQAKGDIGVGRYAPSEQIRYELEQYFVGQSAQFDVPLALAGSAFTRDVWHELRKIPAGVTRSYSEIARRTGNPAAVRAVARANGANQIALVIPCHRVIGADGSLTGYGGGLWRKQKLIEIEQLYRHRSLTAGEGSHVVP